VLQIDQLPVLPAPPMQEKSRRRGTWPKRTSV